MADIGDYIPSITIGTQVSNITGKTEDGLTAGGYSAFITSITGKPPYVQELKDKRARIILDRAQVVAFQKYLDKELGIGMRLLSKPSTLDIDVRPAVIPWALKYVIPASLLLFAGGWIAHWYMSK